MTPLLDAIAAKFTSATLGNTVTGGYHFNHAPAGTAMPFMVVSVIAAPIIDAYGTDKSYQASIQFAVFGTAARTTLAAMQTVIAAYDDTLLSLTGASNTNVYREGQPILIEQPAGDPMKDASVRDVWQASCTYVYTVQ